MKKTFRLQWLERELEKLRMKLYQVTGEKSNHHLNRSQVLSISEQLDGLIVKFMKEQHDQKNC